MKLLKYLNTASEIVQGLFFLALIFVASVVSYSQGYSPQTQGPRSAKTHTIEYLKTFLSGMLAFFFTLLISESQGWAFPWTCLVGGISVLFSKQFFEMLFNVVSQRVFGNMTVPSFKAPGEPLSTKIVTQVDAEPELSNK